MRRISAVVVVTALVVLAAGCARGPGGAAHPGSASSTAQADPSSVSPVVPEQSATATDDLTPSAPPDQGLTTAQVIAVWDAALAAHPTPLILVGDPGAQQLGDWEEAVGGNNKSALLSRHVDLAPDVAGAKGPATGIVRWADGTTRSVGSTSAAATARVLIARSGSDQPCDGCTAIVLTDPRTTIAKVVTATGPATVPAWNYGVRGSKVRLVQPAIDPADLLSDVPGLPSGVGFGETTVHVESDGRLTVHWSGGPTVAQAGACGVDVRPEFVESDRVVVLRLVALPNSIAAPTTPLMCTAVGAVLQQTVTPPHPLGDRLLVQDGSGFVVPRT